MRKLLLILLASLTVAACGQKGPLVPPEPAAFSAINTTEKL
jgi:predicted small lipoprotein YifL